MMDVQFPISSLTLRKLFKSKIQCYCQIYKESSGWLQKFSKRYELALRRRTSISQNLLKQLEEKLSGFDEISDF